MLTTHIVTAGNLAEPPRLAWTPQGLAVATLTVLVSNARDDGWVDAPPTRHHVKAYGALAEHADDCLTAGDRVLVIGTQRVEETYDRATHARHLTTWIHADELGPSLRDHPAPPQRPPANPRARTASSTKAGQPVPLAAVA